MANSPENKDKIEKLNGELKELQHTLSNAEENVKKLRIEENNSFVKERDILKDQVQNARK